MSYNVTNMKVTNGKILPIGEAEFKALRRVKRDSRPEGNFIDDLPDEWAGPIEVDDSSLWYGEFSGHSFDDMFLAKVVPHLKGEFTLRVIWEGGDSVESLKFKGGKLLSRKQI